MRTQVKSNRIRNIRLQTKRAKSISKKMPVATAAIPVGIIMGSDSDLKVMRGAADCLRDFGVPFEIKIVSAHRTPRAMLEYAEKAEDNGTQVIIAGAGGAAHLPGMVASVTLLPVIGVPINATRLSGLDALLSVAQMPKGVPVATVAIDNSYNAGLLAVRILARTDGQLREKLDEFKKQQIKKVEQANKFLNRSRGKLKK